MAGVVYGRPPFSTISYMHSHIFIHDDCQLNRLNVSCCLISSCRRYMYVHGTHAPNFQKWGRQNYVLVPLPFFWQKFRKRWIFNIEANMWSLRRVIRVCFKCNFFVCQFWKHAPYPTLVSFRNINLVAKPI
jgi:hypothetical protein